jgi:hypothetical protein
MNVTTPDITTPIRTVSTTSRPNGALPAGTTPGVSSDKRLSWSVGANQTISPDAISGLRPDERPSPGCRQPFRYAPETANDG